MNKKIVFTFFFVLVLLFSISAIQASDVNLTDLNSSCSSEDASIQAEDITQFMDSGYDNSNKLSAAIDDAPLREDSKNQTEFTSPTSSIYYKGKYKVTLIDSNTTNPLVNKTVNLVINNVNYNVPTDNNGVASVDLELTPGKYTVIASFEGDDDYKTSNLTSTVEILSTIKAKDITKFYKGSTQFTATLVDSQGNALSNRYVSISVNGKTYTKKTNNNGVVDLALNLKPGTYKVVSTDPVTGYKLTTTFKILSTISSDNLKQVQGENKKFKIKFFKNDGKALAKKYVKIKFKGKTRKMKTDSKGYITLPLKKLKKGTYKVVCYNKDGLSKSNTIKIYKRKASTKLTTQFYTFLPGDNREIKVKLSTALGDNSNSGKTVKIKINGKTYSRKTDSNGIASINLASFAKGRYIVQYSYAGNKFFNAAKATNLVTILDNASDTALTVKSTTHFGYGAGTSFKVALTAGGVPLAKRTVTFTIGTKTYTKTTDNNGIASLPINLNIGNYTINYKTYDQFKVNGTSGSCDIDVFKRGASKLSWKCGNSYKDSSQTFKVLLTDSKGKGISGQTVELTIDGERHTAKTASNGYAKFKTDVAFGKYKLSVKFKGSNDFLSSSMSHKINVKLSQFGKGLNQKNAVSYLSAYLKSSSHCKVGSAKIKKLVKSLTKGLHSKVDKAKAIFNYVRDNIKYKFYYNSHYGSGATLKNKQGNCADQANLLVAMYRTAGFKARYVHGRCHFNSGNTYGHVWVQVAIGKTWVCADTTDSCNDLGKITGWNTKSYKVLGKHSSIPF